MIIINLKGGLGNQMFQYALGYVLAKKNNTQLFCDTRLQEEHKINTPPRNVPREIDLDVFDIKIDKPKMIDLIKVFQFFKSYRIRNYIAYIFDKFGLCIIREKSRKFNLKVFNSNFKNLYLDGLWQSERYFIDYRNELIKIFNFKKIEKDKKNCNFIEKINFNKSVCLNVRRTDFIRNPEHNVVNIDYINVYIFSDDLDWCKKNFFFLKNKYFVEHDFAGKKFYNYLYLMSKFKNFIIPNSSFAWWAAWLSQRSNKVIIVPENWSGLVNKDLIDIIPLNWIKIKF